MWVLNTWFCRNLSNWRVGAKLQKWWGKKSTVSWEDLIRRIDERVKEEEQIRRK